MYPSVHDKLMLNTNIKMYNANTNGITSAIKTVRLALEELRGNKCNSSTAKSLYFNLIKLNCLVES